MKLKLLFVSIFLLTLVSTASAGEIDPEFVKELNGLSNKDTAVGIIHMKEQVDLKALNKSLLFPKRLPAKLRHEKVIRALQEKAKISQQPLLEMLEQDGRVEVVTSFWITNAVIIKATPPVFFEVAAREDVEYVFSNHPIELIEPVSSSVASSTGRGIEIGILGAKAPDLWALGITGQGAIACNIDTGVDGTHAALSSRWRGLDPGVAPQAAFFDPVTNHTFPKDFSGHGTHTMGTICGANGPANQVGMAPQAKWIAAATIDRVNLSTTKLDAYASFQWCADPDGNPATDDDVPDVCSNSWGISPLIHSGTPKGWDYFNLVIDGCEAAGCIVVFAAGNEGWAGPESLRCPSDRIDSPVNVLSVGGLKDDQKTRASFSSIGPSGVDHFTIKPEVMAQGDNVRSCLSGGGYGTKSGTSMACPHVAGAAVLLRSAFPESTPYEVKAALLYTAKDLGPAGDDNEYGSGRINCLQAYNFLKSSLMGDSKELSVTAMNQDAMFFLNAGPSYANRKYILLGSASGTNPGLPLPGGQVLPINWDQLTTICIMFLNTPNFQNFSGVLDQDGRKTALLDIGKPPEATMIGAILSFAYCTAPPGGWNFVSNNWDIEITF